MTDQNMLQALLRKDLVAFIEKVFSSPHPGTTYVGTWHIEAMAHVLEACLQGDIQRLVITLPPRSLKSTSTSVAFPAWLLGHDPSRHIIGISYAQDLAEKHSMDCRRIIEEPWYQKTFPTTRVSPVKNTAPEFVTTRHGGRLATSVGGSLTGRGADFIIIDDFHKADEGLSIAKRTTALEWYNSTVPSRLNDKKKGVIIVVQQRLHEEDLAGVLLAHGGWTHLNLPAIAEESSQICIGNNQHYSRKEGDLLHPEREPQEVLDELKSTIGSIAFAAQYQQRPTPMEGGIIKWPWFKGFDGDLHKQPGDSIVQSWDIACTVSSTASYSVCTTWLAKPSGCYLIAVYREQLEYPALKHAVEKLNTDWNPDLIVIEQTPGSLPLIQSLRAEGHSQVKGHTPQADKITRMICETPLLESGKVFLRMGDPYLKELKHELVNFPAGKHDDQVDSISQFLYWYRVHSHLQYPQQATLKVTVTYLDPMPDLDLSSLYY